MIAKTKVQDFGSSSKQSGLSGTGGSSKYRANYRKKKEDQPPQRDRSGKHFFLLLSQHYHIPYCLTSSLP